MFQKKAPQRMCVVCRSMKDKNELLRIVRNKEGKIFIDPTLKAAGRGAYICKDSECLKKAQKTNALSRALSAQIGEDIYFKLNEEFEKFGNK